MAKEFATVQKFRNCVVVDRQKRGEEVSPENRWAVYITQEKDKHSDEFHPSKKKALAAATRIAR